MSAEQAARRTAAAAVLADYAEACASGADVADRALWAARLADMLGLVLADLGAQPPGAAEQLEEIEALRDLIDAAAQCADVPIAAPGHLRQDDRLAWIRADTIRAYLRDIDYGAEYLCAVLADKAQALREQAAKPVTYEVYQPAQAAATAIVAEAIKTGTPVIVEDDFVQDRHVDLDAGENGGAMADADYYDRIAEEGQP